MKRLAKSIAVLIGFLLAAAVFSIIGVLLGIPPQSLERQIIGGFIGGILGAGAVSMFFFWALD